ncbi:MAG TPA: DUF3305 domain-containing protein [Burkholderiales bacterium]|nr:DUF3305 domain-containing protein [Burkholderiales bacterium]
MIQQLAVVMQRRAIDNPWQDHVWEPVGVVPDGDGATGPRRLVSEPRLAQWLHPGFRIALRRSEAAGYFHNVTAAAPSVFVLWRMEGEQAVPHYVTASYDEASRWMDGGAQVDAVPMPAALCEWVAAFVAEHYKPEPKKRLRPRSFLSPAERT